MVFGASVLHRMLTEQVGREVGRGSCVWGLKGHPRGHLLEHWILSFIISIDTGRHSEQAPLLSGTEAGGRVRWVGRDSSVFICDKLTNAGQ